MEMNMSVFDEFPVLKTKRLTLREIKVEDGEAIFKMRSNGRVNQFIPRPTMEKVSSGEELARKTAEAYQRKEVIGWAGILRDQNQIIGTCGFNSIEFHNLRAEIGGELSVDYWGKHIALEAVSAIVDFGLYEFGLHSIEAKVSPDNRGAIAILEYLGFRKEAHFKDRGYFNGTFWDMAVYSYFGR